MLEDLKLLGTECYNISLRQISNFQEISKKKQLLFVFRDFDDETDNYERITTKLENELKTLWSKVFKPDNHSSA